MSLLMNESPASVACGSSTLATSPPATTITAATHLDACNSFFEHAAHHNADGVVCLQRGDCGRAFHSFVTALSTLHKFRAYQQMVEDTGMVSLPPPPTTNKNCKAIAVPYLQDSGFFIYNNAVLFSRKPRIGSSKSWEMDTIRFCEAVAQFNLGLAYHQRGKYCGEDRTLLGALELYEQSLSVLQSIDGCDAEVLKLAVMNNRIHILNELARYPAAQLLVNDLLVQSVQALSATEGNSNALSFLTRADIDHFLLNALVIRRYNTAPCA